MTAWVLLRGLTREAGHWGDFPELFGQAMSGERIYCIDFPGNGKRYCEQSALTVEAMADFCHARWLEIGDGASCRILALSLGAMVAVAWAQRHPADIVETVLVNTSLRPFSHFHHRLRPRNYRIIISLLLGADGGAALEAKVLAMTSGRAWTPDEHEALVAAWCRLRSEHPVSAMNALRQLVAAARFNAPAHAPVATRLLASRGDGLVDSRCSEALARAWGVPLCMHPTAGHDLPLDDPEWVIRQALCPP